MSGADLFPSYPVPGNRHACSTAKDEALYKMVMSAPINELDRWWDVPSLFVAAKHIDAFFTPQCLTSNVEQKLAGSGLSTTLLT
jgi:hypothetical protein